MVRFVFSKTARNDIQGLDSAVRKRLHKKLMQLEQKDALAQLKKLTDHPSAEYRLRIGDYRLLLDKAKDTLVILRIRHRKEPYRT